MPRMWHDEQLSLGPLRDQTIAVIGYGIQGAAQASNMRDSGLKVLVGLRKGGRSWEVAAKEGHKVLEVVEAARAADIVHMLIPDMEQSRVYREAVAPQLTKGKALSFSHGAAIHWRWIVPPDYVDVIMLAPKAPGQRVRELYLQNFGTPALVAVQRDASGGAWNRILGMAKATGCARAGIIETTFKEEVETDWFGEQADLCGGVDRLVRTALETLVEAGYQPEIAYFECLHELKLIVDLIQKYGIAGMYRRVSETARYGGLTRGGRVIGTEVRKSMKRTLDEIQKGNFAKEWVEAYGKEGSRAFEKYLGELDKHQIEEVGRRLRSIMWPREAVS
ncbi:MAG: ketol-acid reductoisomerase [Thaumarchaeota archaeon]|nr:MAG: ketol-acid reductoisomerase [Nitrososphaerota archaeon]